MTPPNKLIERANSLMQRKRIFVAGAPAAPTGTDPATPDDEDLPVLTEIVDISEVSGTPPSAAVSPPLDPLADIATLEYCRQLQQRIAAELPGLIGEAAARLTAEVQVAVQRIAEQSLREFLAQRRNPAPDAPHDDQAA